MSKELKVTKERVRKVAESYPEAKEVLKELFPEAFKFEPFEITFEVSSMETLYNLWHRLNVPQDNFNPADVSSSGVIPPLRELSEKDTYELWRIIDKRINDLS